MSLRKKTLTGVCTALVLLIAGLFLYSQKVIQGGFSLLETRDARLNVGRIRDGIGAEVENLTIKMADWAAWDDTYKYISDHNAEYSKSNLNAATIGNMQLHQMSFWDTNRKMVFGSNIDLENDNAMSPLSKEDYKLISENDYFHKFENENDRKMGIVTLSSGPCVVSVLPIITSEGKGPIRGSIVSIRKMHTGFFEKLSKVTHLNVNFVIPSSSEIPSDFSEAIGEFSKGSKEHIKRINDKSIAGYAPFSDVFGKPAVVVKMDVPREVHAQGQRTIWSFMTAMLLAGLVLMGVIVLILEKSVLAKISSLVSQIRRVEDSGDLSLRVGQDGQDEIAHLGHSMNKMLGAVENSKNQVKLLLDNAEQGFLSFDLENKIVSESSRALEKLFGKNVSGQKIWEVLGQNENDWRLFSESLFEELIEFKDLAALGAKSVNIRNRNIELEYRAVRDENKKVSQVMIVATDMTEVRELERQSKAQQQRNLAIVKVLISKNDFIELMDMSKSLMKSVTDLREFKRHLHTLKGGFAFLECKDIADVCHEWETKIAAAEGSLGVKEVALQAASEVWSRVEQFVNENDSILQLKDRKEKVVPVSVEQIMSLVQVAQNLSSPPSLLDSLEKLLERSPHEAFSFMNAAFKKTAEKLGKEVHDVEWVEGSVGIIPENYPGLFKALVHVARNAADHGIEDPADRESLGKSREGHLKASLSEKGEYYYLSFKDDGNGADVEQLAKKAQSKGIALPKQKEQYINLLFEDGLSTKSEVIEFSGRGVGLDAVRTEARRLGGDAEAINFPGQGLELRIRFKKLRIKDVLHRGQDLKKAA